MASTTSDLERETLERLKPLVARLNRKEDELYGVVSKSLRGATRSASYWNRVRAETGQIYREMTVIFDDWAKKEMPAAVRKSLTQIRRRISTSGSLAVRARRGLEEALRSRATSQLALALYSDASGGFLSAVVAGRNNLERFTRLTQQALVQERVLDLSVAQGIELGDLRKAIGTISGRLSGELVDMVREKQFVQAGSRRYRPSTYAEVVARTKFHEAHTAAALSEARTHDTDLVQVSSHNTTTAICIPYEGRVYSVSGKDERFPKLDNTPPYHPNCLHLIFPTFESGMIAEGTLEAHSAFSRGEIERPPNVPGFVPVAERLQTAAASSALRGVSRQGVVSVISKKTEEKQLYQKTTKIYKDKNIASLRDRFSNYHIRSTTERESSYYLSKTRQVVTESVGSRSFMASARHEIGHHLDFSMGHKLRSVTASWNDTGFQDAIRLTTKDLRGVVGFSGVSPVKLSQDAQDLLDNLSHGKIRTMYGHSKKYYDSTYYARNTEAFADLVSVYGSGDRKEISILEKHLPQLTTAFKDLIEKGLRL